MGPGLRSVVWVQGCPFSCSGCIAPEWIPFRPGRLVYPAELVQELLADPAVSGLTFSGGEPMLQARALAELARRARQERELSLICFSGFRLEELKTHPDYAGVEELLAEVDVLITDRYERDLNDGKGLRGSSNQRVVRLTSRLLDFDFENAPRRAEIQVGQGSIFLVGVPPHGAVKALRTADKNFRQEAAWRGSDERL